MNKQQMKSRHFFEDGLKKQVFVCVSLLLLMLVVLWQHFLPLQTSTSSLSTQTSAAEVIVGLRNQIATLQKLRIAYGELYCQEHGIGPTGGFCVESVDENVGGNTLWDQPVCSIMANVLAGKTVLDLGCGLGWYGKCLGKANKDIKWTGLDGSEGIVHAWVNKTSVRPRLLVLAEEHPELQHGLDTLVEILDNGGMFASLAVQVHYEDAITQQHLHWHTDWANSLLHSGMTIGKGRRAVHRKCARTADATQAEDMAVWFNPGESYVSSPKFFYHGVEFPQIEDWKGRVIALQSRMILSPEQHHSLLSSNLNDKEVFFMAWTDLMRELDMVFVALPTVDDVKAVISNHG